MSQIENSELLWKKIIDGGIWLVVMFASPNYYPNLSAADIRAVVAHDK